MTKLHAYLIMEVGGTKTAARFVDGDHVESIQTLGYHPGVDYNKTELFDRQIADAVSRSSQLFYYGTGVYIPGASELLTQWFKKYNPTITVHIASDMLAAARATCQSMEGYVAILGTGSNTCYYDGREIRILNPSLGYILGDVASGAYIGKRLLADYFNNKMPTYISDSFKSQFDVTLGAIIENTYKKNNPNTFLAKFSFFLNSNRDEWKQDFLDKIFKEFLLLHFEESHVGSNIPLHFVGSIAYHYKDILTKSCKDLNIIIGTVLNDPIDALTIYHNSKDLK